MTEPQQPPAGWYPDPQDATQQRYWDGSTWTGHTAPQGGPSAAPQGDAAVGAPIPAAAAPAWTAPMAGADPGAAGKKSWYKRPLFLVPLVIVAALIVVGIVVAVTQGPDHSSALDKIILRDGQAHLQAEASQLDPGATVKVTSVHCVESGTSQQYSCLAYFTLTKSNGQSTSYVQHVAATCNRKFSNASCIWHQDGSPTETTGG